VPVFPRCRSALTVAIRSLSRFVRSSRDSVLPSFPTRRSSDLHAAQVARGTHGGHDRSTRRGGGALRGGRRGRRDHHQPAPGEERSEEHTSELQSREKLVCRLLLEKKRRK